MLFSPLEGGSSPGVAGVPNLVGLAAMCLVIGLPSRADHSSVDRVIRTARVWSLLLAVGAGCLVAGMYLRFSYNFPRFALSVGAFFLVGFGLVEFTWRKTSFSWLLRILKNHVGGREHHDSFPVSAAWRIEGAVKILVGTGAAIVLVIASL
jgi:hypothetical protein